MNNVIQDLSIKLKDEGSLIHKDTLVELLEQMLVDCRLQNDTIATIDNIKLNQGKIQILKDLLIYIKR